MKATKRVLIFVLSLIFCIAFSVDVAQAAEVENHELAQAQTTLQDTYNLKGPLTAQEISLIMSFTGEPAYQSPTEEQVNAINVLLENDVYGTNADKILATTSSKPHYINEDGKLKCSYEHWVGGKYNCDWYCRFWWADTCYRQYYYIPILGTILETRCYCVINGEDPAAVAASTTSGDDVHIEQADILEGQSGKVSILKVTHPCKDKQNKEFEFPPPQ